jgi:hypothetical protein
MNGNKDKANKENKKRGERKEKRREKKTTTRKFKINNLLTDDNGKNGTSI